MTMRTFPSPLPQSLAGRWELLLDLYAPMDEEGVRHPEAGVISRENFLELADSTSEEKP